MGVLSKLKKKKEHLCNVLFAVWYARGVPFLDQLMEGYEWDEAENLRLYEIRSSFFTYREIPCQSCAAVGCSA